MSSDNINEINDHKSCHSDDVLEHIDDEPQKEFVENLAPKAQEEISIINQDNDYSPIDEINAPLDEENDGESHNVDTITIENTGDDEQLSINLIEESDELVAHEKKVESDELIIQEDKEEPVELATHEDKEESYELGHENKEECDEVIALNEIIVHEEDFSEQCADYELEDEKLVDHENKEEINDLGHENKEESDEVIALNEIIAHEEDFNEQAGAVHLDDEQCADYESKDKNLVDHDMTEKNDLNEEQLTVGEPLCEECLDECELPTLQTNGNSELTNEGSNENDFTKPNGAITVYSKQSKDIKTLSSTYNTEDNANFNCEVCNKTVYPLEKISANNHIFHKQCFRCTKCRCALLAGNFSFNNDKPYCRPHYLELFKKRGRYDEIDDGETISSQTNINDIITDDLPAPDITKNLLAKFRDLESGAGTTISNSPSNSDITDELPAPNTTKNLRERFSALGKELDREKSDQKRKPMIEMPRLDGNGACENEPLALSKDVVRANEPGQDDMPEQGITKNLVDRFRILENSSSVSSK